MTSTNNTTFSALNNAQVFTGNKDNVEKFASIVVYIKSDQDCLLEIQHSADGSNFDIVDSFNVSSASAKSCQVETKGKWARVVCTNNSGSDMSVLRLQTSYRTIPQRIGLDSDSLSFSLATDAQVKAMASDGSSDVQLKVNGSSQLQVFNNSTLSAANDAVSVMGDDGAGTKRQLHVDTSGNLHVIVPDGLEVNIANDLNVVNSLTVGTMPNVTINDGASVNIGSLPAVNVNDKSTSVYRNLDVGTSSSQVKGSAGKLYSLCLCNTTGFDAFLKIYDKASSATSSDTPVSTIYVIANTSQTHAFSEPLAFSNGLQLRCTSDIADNSSVSPNTNSCMLTAIYA